MHCWVPLQHCVMDRWQLFDSLPGAMVLSDKRGLCCARLGSLLRATAGRFDACSLSERIRRVRFWQRFRLRRQGTFCLVEDMQRNLSMLV
jgi:hypothetical protein